jgi:hypothetical protein
MTTRKRKTVGKGRTFNYVLRLRPHEMYVLEKALDCAALTGAWPAYCVRAVWDRRLMRLARKVKAVRS